VSPRVWTVVSLLAGALWGLALLLWAQHGPDEAVLLWSAGLEPEGLAIRSAQLASRYGKALMGIVLLGALVASVRRASWRPLRPVFLVTLMSLAISAVAGNLLKEVVERPRPRAAHPELGLPAPESTTSSFPSGHSTKAVALALPFLVCVAGWRGWTGAIKATLAGLALAVCASRLVLGAHYLSDVTGGLAMALSGLPLAVLASGAILRTMTPEDLDRAGWIWTGVYVVLVVILWALS
jgi:undecaprenyl-diphosphatase